MHSGQVFASRIQLQANVHFVHVSNQTRLSDTVKGTTVKLILYMEQHETQRTPVPGRKTILKYMCTFFNLYKQFGPFR